MTPRETYEAEEQRKIQLAKLGKISQLLKYHPSDLESYVGAIQRFKDHPFLASHEETLIPLRGGFMFALLSHHLNNKPDLKRTHFMPASEFLFEAGQVTRVFIRNYIQDRMKRYEREGTPLRVLMIDEAKSGRAANSLFKRFQEVIKSLKETEAEEQASEILSPRAKGSYRAFDQMRKTHEKTLNMKMKEELRQLREIQRNFTKRQLKLVTENGDYTPEGVLILRLLRRHGMIQEETAENLLSHRILMERRLGTVTRATWIARLEEQFEKEKNPAKRKEKMDHIARLKSKSAGEKFSLPDVLERTQVLLDYPLEQPEDLKDIFPLITPHFVRSHNEIEKKRYIQFFNHVMLNPQTHDLILANKEIYDATFATLTNYRLNELLNATGEGPAFTRTLEKLSDRVTSKYGSEKSAFRERLNHFHSELDAYRKHRRIEEFAHQRREQLESLLQEASRFNNVDLKVLAVHGVDNFITTDEYVKLKDAGVVSQIDMNKIVTMDNPSTPVVYAREIVKGQQERKIYDASVKSTPEFWKVLIDSKIPSAAFHLPEFGKRVQRDIDQYIRRGKRPKARPEAKGR